MTQNIPIGLCLSFFVQKCPVLTTLVLHFFECSSRILPYSFGKKVLFPKKTKRRVKENCLRELRSQTFSLCSGIGSVMISGIDYISKSVIEPVEITAGEKFSCWFLNNLDSYGMTSGVEKIIFLCHEFCLLPSTSQASVQKFLAH